MKRLGLFSVLLVASLASSAQGAVVTYTDINLASGNPVTVDSVTLTTSNAGGSISFIGAGTYTGLWLGASNTGGTYSLGFSQAITSIEIEFDALSSIGGLPVETLFGFNNSNGAVSINYTNQSGTSFDGTTITSLQNDGQGIINFAGPAFNSFSFTHNQGTQNGFVIERLVINTTTTTSDVPEPGALGLLGAGLVGLWLTKRRRG